MEEKRKTVKDFIDVLDRMGLVPNMNEWTFKEFIAGISEMFGKPDQLFMDPLTFNGLSAQLSNTKDKKK